jgi:hypothetical protein
MTIGLRHVALIFAVIVAALAMFGIAFAVVEWRAEDPPDLEPTERQLERLRQDVDRLKDQPAVAGTDVSATDIEQLYARVNYLDCWTDAQVLLQDAETEEDETFRNYVTDNSTYAVYEAAYNRYLAAYDDFSATLDSCWQTYLDESPLE